MLPLTLSSSTIIEPQPFQVRLTNSSRVIKPNDDLCALLDIQSSINTLAKRSDYTPLAHTFSIVNLFNKIGDLEWWVYQKASSIQKTMSMHFSTAFKCSRVFGNFLLNKMPMMSARLPSLDVISNITIIAGSFLLSLCHSKKGSEFQCTADLYKSDNSVFVGDFIESRSKVDFSYHGNYQIERQLVQDSIIHKYLKFGKSVYSPKIIFTAGVMGAGKGHILKKMDLSGQINSQDYLLIDPDQLKDELPEMQKYIDLDPKTSGTRVHKESGFILEIILSEALKQNKNIIVDGSLTSLLRHKMLFESIRRDYPRYTIDIIYVKADLQKIKERIQKRGKEIRRFVPIDKVEYAYHQIPKTVETLTPLASRVIIIDNNNDDGLQSKIA